MSKTNTSLSQQEHQEFLQAVKLISQPKFREHFKELNGIIRKISDIIHLSLNKEGSIKYDFIDFEKFPESWGSDFLPAIVDSIANKTVIEIYYQPFYEDKPYFTHVHPYLLREYRNRWYLIGLNDQKKELRTYALDRIWKIKEISKSYIPRIFDADDYFKYTVGVISLTGIPAVIRIEVKKPQAHYLITQPLHSSQNVDYENEDSMGFSYKVHPTYEFKSILLSLGSDLKVIGPASLKEEILKELKSTLESYEGDVKR